MLCDRLGDFCERSSRELAEKIAPGGVAGLCRVLAGGAPPTGRDRAGHDLLAFAAVVVRDRAGDPEMLRSLLEAGADPDARDPESGMTAMAGAGDRPELVWLLVEASASVDQRLPGGESMLVLFVGLRRWESAL